MDLILSIPPILFAITIHEYAHGYVAHRLGDPTPYFAGRLTLNPVRHIDPIGAIVFLLAGFGWAKPVPIDSSRLGIRGMRKVSFAGPLANLLTGICSGLVARIIPDSAFFLPLFKIFYFSLILNIAFGLFNLIPIPPLDGSHILESYLPFSYRLSYRRIAPYGMMILIIAIFFDRLTGIGILWGWIGPVINIFSTILVGRPFFHL
ncbi:MAG TPA: site-2 protease family protein [bacterium (Candidatus Stahlbacteria)]|nr:site-2 protease family protein [Candidatus Stahlbacteria bacterium]